MAGKMPGNRVYASREARGQFSARFIEPFARKFHIGKCDPEILKQTLKKIVKNMENSGIASFHSEEHVYYISKENNERFLQEKIENFCS